MLEGGGQPDRVMPLVGKADRLVVEGFIDFRLDDIVSILRANFKRKGRPPDKFKVMQDTIGRWVVFMWQGPTGTRLNRTWISKAHAEAAVRRLKEQW